MRASLKELIAKIMRTDLVIESGTDADNWHYKKYASGRLEADRVYNIGQYTFNTTEISPIRVGGQFTLPSPSMMTSGHITGTLMASSSNSSCFLEYIGETTVRVAKVASSNVTVQNMTIGLRVINGRWK